MDAVLLVNCKELKPDLLRRELAGTLELIQTQSIAQAEAMLTVPRLTVLVLDCDGDAGAEYDLLRRVERDRPELECIALVDARHFCSIRETRSRNLFRLLKPADPGELGELILRTVQKAAVANSGAWRGEPGLRRRQDRQFWTHLLTGVLLPREEKLLLAAPPTTFDYRAGQTVLPVLFCIRRWHEESAPLARDDRRYAFRTLVSRTLLRSRPGCVVPWTSDTPVLFLYGPDLPDEEELRAQCARMTSIAGAHFGCDISCYLGQPCLAHEVSAQVECLRRGDMDNVTNARAVLSLEELKRSKEPLSPPVLRDWMPYFVDGREEEFCRCIEAYFEQSIAANNMDRALLARFQQDFIQEIGFALKNAGKPLHSLFSDPDELVWMEQATRYVPDMMAWVRSTADRATRLMELDQARMTISQRVCDYINRRLVYSFRREALSRELHLSDGHIARVFKREMGMSITEYLTEKRIGLACLIIRQTNLPLSQVAEQSGFHDYPHFYKTFKKRMGVSPTEYQAQTQDQEG